MEIKIAQRWSSFITRKIDKWDAHVFRDKDGFTITFVGKGGAIMSGTTYKETEKKFIEAMHLAESVKKLMDFGNNGKMFTESFGKRN